MNLQTSAPMRELPAGLGLTTRMAYFYARNTSWILGTLAVVVVFTAWELVVGLGYIDPFFLSRPSDIFMLGFQMVRTGEIFPHLFESGKEGVLGFSLAILVGIPVGFAMGTNATARHLLEPFVMALYSTPSIALLPLFILWLGIGLWSKVIIIFLGGLFSMVINTEAGVRAVDPLIIETARSFLANRRQIFFKIILPSAFPYIIAGLRLAVGRIIIMVVVAELYAAKRGIGFMLMEAGTLFETTKLFVGVLILMIFGVGLSQTLRVIERRQAPWLSINE